MRLQDHSSELLRLVLSPKFLAATCCREGEEGDNFYIIESGHFKATKADGDKEKLLFAYHDEGAFGELALMYNCPRAATVTVRVLLFATPAQTWYC